MATSKPPQPDAVVPADVTIHEGVLPQPQVQSALEWFPPEIHQLLGQGEHQQEGPLQLATTCHKLRLYDAKVTQVKQLALWRRQPPRVAAPRMPSKRITVKNGVIPHIHARLRRGRFRPVQVRLRQLEPVCLPMTQTDTDFARQIPWSIPVFPLETFSAKQQTYYRWYSRDRLGLDLDDADFVGLCCHLPPLELEVTSIQEIQGDMPRLFATSQGPSSEALEGRHGLVFNQPGKEKIVRVPPPTS